MSDDTDEPQTPAPEAAPQPAAPAAARPADPAPGRRIDDHALASSAPDDSSTLLKMLGRLERLKPEPLAAILIGTAVMFWTVVRFGGDLAIKVYPMVAEIARYSTDHKSAAATAEASADRTAILEAIKAVDTKVDKLGSDVDSLKRDQAATSRRVDRIKADQQRKTQTPAP